jgi:hypothetical protein
VLWISQIVHGFEGECGWLTREQEELIPFNFGLHFEAILGQTGENSVSLTLTSPALAIMLKPSPILPYLGY